MQQPRLEDTRWKLNLEHYLTTDSLLHHGLPDLSHRLYQQQRFRGRGRLAQLELKQPLLQGRQERQLGLDGLGDCRQQVKEDPLPVLVDLVLLRADRLAEQVVEAHPALGLQLLYLVRVNYILKVQSKVIGQTMFSFSW